MSSTPPRVISRDIRSMLPTAAVGRYAEPHARAAAGRGARLDRAAVRLDQTLRDREAEPGAASVGRSDEPIEDVGELIRIDAGACVIDDEARAARVIGGDRDGDAAAGRRVPCCVREQ